MQFKFFLNLKPNLQINIKRYLRKPSSKLPTHLKTLTNIENVEITEEHKPSIETIKENIDLKSLNIPATAQLTIENDPDLIKSLNLQKNAAAGSVIEMKTVKFAFEPESRLKEDNQRNRIVTLDTLELSEDPSVPKSGIKCSGCGAALHCHNKHQEGFIPANEFKLLTKQEKNFKVCYRCDILNTRRKMLNVETNKFDYDEFILKNICAQSNAHVILLVDLLDIPNSIYAGWSKLIQKQIQTADNEVNLAIWLTSDLKLIDD